MTSTAWHKAFFYASAMDVDEVIVAGHSDTTGDADYNEAIEADLLPPSSPDRGVTGVSVAALAPV